jgi:hypothetical protein
LVGVSEGFEKVGFCILGVNKAIFWDIFMDKLGLYTVLGFYK